MPALVPIDEASLGIEWTGVRDGSTPTFSFGISENRLEMSCFVAWNLIADAVKFFVGYAETYGTGSGRQLSRLMPYAHPEFPGLVCTKVLGITGHQILPTADSNGLPQYSRAHFRLLFESVPYKLLADVETSTELDRYVEVGPSRGSASAITFPGGALLYSPPDYFPAGHYLNQVPAKPVPFNISKIRPQERFQIVWHRLPEDVWDDDGPLKGRLYGLGDDNDGIPYIGCINDADIFGRPAGTLLLESVDAAPHKSPLGLGDLEFTLTFSFCFDPNGWNWLWWTRPGALPGESGYCAVSTDGSFHPADTLPDGVSIYNSTSFDWLFNVADG